MKRIKKETLYVVLVFAFGFLIRFFTLLPLSDLAEVLFRWAAQSNVVTHPLLSFKHIYLIYRSSACPPFYYFVSFVLFKIFKILQSILASHISTTSWDILTNIVMKIPVLLADVGISFLIYKIALDKTSNQKTAVILAGLYLWNPAIIYAEMLRVQTLSFALFFILVGIYLLDSKKWHFISSPLYAIGVSSLPNPFVAIPYIFILIVKAIKEKKYAKYVTSIVIFVVCYLFIIGIYSNFTFKPPQVDNLAGQNMPPIIFKPLPTNLSHLYPLKLVYANNYPSPYVTNPAFNGFRIFSSICKDEVKLAGIPRKTWGFIFIALSVLLSTIALSLQRKTDTKAAFTYMGICLLSYFIFFTRESDFFLMSAIPFIIIGFSEFRRRIAYYILSTTLILNLFITDHFNLTPPIPTIIPSLMHLISLINTLLLIAGIYYFFAISKEEDPVKEGELIKEKLFKTLPILQRCQNWLLVRENQYLLILLFISFLIRMGRLGVPEELNFDEKYYVPMARDYFLKISSPVEGASHPPLATYLIGIGIGLLGYNPFGWRIISVLFSLAMITLVYYFAKALFKNHIPAIISAFLISFDFLHFVHSRLGMLDMYSSFFNLASYYLFFLYIEKGKNKYLYGLATTLALGLACKWTTLFTIAGILTLWASSKIASIIWKDKFKYGSVLGKTNLWKVVALLILIPLVFQIFVFMPLYQWHIQGVFLKLKQLVSYHQNLVGQDKISSPWWSWIFIINPIQYTRGQIGVPKMVKEGPFFIVKLKEYDASEQFAVTGMGNPLVWWISLPAFVASLYIAFKKRIYASAYICMPFIFQYLPWAFAKRITYLFYMIDVIPYMCIVIGFCLWQIYQLGKNGKRLVWGYLTLVFLSFVAFYPLLTAISLPPAIYNMYKIFHFWQFK